MLLFFFPAHSETSLKTAVAVSVTATLKHVGVVVIVKVVASVLQKSYTLYAFRYMQMESLQIWTIGTICCDPRSGIDKYSRQTREKSE